MNPTPTESRSKTKVVLIIVGVFAVLAILGGVIYALVLAGTKKTDTPTGNQPTPTKTVTTGETLAQGAEKLNKAVEKEKAQREKAQQALNDQVKRTTLAN